MKDSAFEPDEIWEPRTPSFDVDSAIHAAKESLNNQDPARLIAQLKAEVLRSPSGIVYAVLKGESPEEYSDTDAIVTFNPFANTATANMLVRAEFIRQVAKDADVRDENGKLKPVIVLSSPGLHGSKLHLTRKEKQEVRSGDLGSAAREYLQAVSELGYGHVALLGYSQGADLALAGAKQSASVNLDKTSLGVG